MDTPKLKEQTLLHKKDNRGRKPKFATDEERQIYKMNYRKKYYIEVIKPKNLLKNKKIIIDI